MTDQHQRSKGPISWMAGNSVAANLLMVILLVGGLIFLSQIKQEVFPEFSADQVTVSVIYSGASPKRLNRASSSRLKTLSLASTGLMRSLPMPGKVWELSP